MRFTYAQRIQKNYGIKNGMADLYEYTQDGLGTGLAVIDSQTIAFGKPTLNTFNGAVSSRVLKELVERFKDLGALGL